MLVKAESVTGKVFDFVIVGGGTAGLTLAARLSEDAHHSVLVLEAGKAHLDDPMLQLQGLWGRHFNNPEYDWSHVTVPQDHCNGKQFYWPRGKALGGSSVINFMGWSRPPAEDIDDIEKLGNSGWNWNNLKKYGAKSERFFESTINDIDPDLLGEKMELGTEGSISLSFPRALPTAESYVQKTLRNLGHHRAKDPLGGDPTGICAVPNTMEPNNYTRSSSVDGYYLPAKERQNLSVLVEALVSKIILDRNEDGNVVAREVEFEHEGQMRTVCVGKEVILSAGSLKTPQILELSGIGKRDVLERLGIPLHVDLPVGENLQEHITCGLSFELRDDVDCETIDILRDPEEFKKQLELHAKGEGLLTRMAIVGFCYAPLQKFSERADEIHEAIAKEIETKKDTYPPGLYDQYVVQLDRLRRGGPGCEIVGVPGFYSYPNPPKVGKRYWSLCVMLNNQFGRGNVHCSTTNFRDDPAYDPRYLQERVDFDSLVEMVKFARKVSQTSPFKDIVAEEINPGPSCTDDVQIGEWIKRALVSVFHTSSTASMLPKDKGGVVGPELKVYGTQNIRVCDLSILPLHISVHPLATVYAFAERVKNALLMADDMEAWVGRFLKF